MNSATADNQIAAKRHKRRKKQKATADYADFTDKTQGNIGSHRFIFSLIRDIRAIRG
jgi:hypothetical protein